MSRALYMRMKELDEDSFESLIDQLLQARYPSSEIRRVNGKGGDQGVDVFLGTLGNKISVWQAKHFVNGFGSRQKKNILESLQQVRKHHQIDTWTLCLPIDFTLEQQRWFDREVRTSFSRYFDVKLMQASNLLSMLSIYTHVRDQIFPGVFSDIAALRELAINTLDLTTEQRSNLAEETNQQYLSALSGYDQRFRYGVSYGTAPLIGPLDDLHLASFWDDSKRVDIFARDAESIRQAPVTASFKFARKAQEKLENLMNSGFEQTFEAGEVLSFDPPAFLKQFMCSDSQPETLRVQPLNAQQFPEVPTRLVVSSTDDEVAYSLVYVKTIALGQKTLTFEIRGNLPITFRVTIPVTGGTDSEINITFSAAGFKASQIKKAFAALQALSSDASISIFDLENERFMMSLKPNIKLIPINVRLKALLDKILAIEKRFNCSLDVPLRGLDEREERHWILFMR